MSTITVTGKVLGRSKPLFTNWRVPIPPIIGAGGEVLTLRILLTQIVLAEVAAFQTRQEQRRLIQVLSRAEIEQKVLLGKVDMGGEELNQEVDPQAAVANALQAFEDGIYFVFIDDVQQHKLDSEVVVNPDSQLMFLRLVPLVGG
ncbi:hypothetical protein [Aliterella atlantica]|uniref:Uncharacterized protein n=1 Tax=Aliterella atlantica CENA595 TaxID=1618023 RepID=A0A0D8ZPQ9_9CYAN|nr:hypothetical protein [Aliterella atlantica]KJH70793.1 hypothetical protein UH38_16345 [Aliterella atlantica CENA595]